MLKSEKQSLNEYFLLQRAEKRQAVESGEMGGVKRGRGRPKGSRNKPRDPSENGTAKVV